MSPGTLFRKCQLASTSHILRFQIAAIDANEPAMGRFFALAFLYSLALSMGSGAAAHAISTVACSDVLTETASIGEDDVNQSNEGSSKERSHCVS